MKVYAVEVYDYLNETYYIDSIYQTALNAALRVNDINEYAEEESARICVYELKD